MLQNKFFFLSSNGLGVYFLILTMTSDVFSFHKTLSEKHQTQCQWKLYIARMDSLKKIRFYILSEYFV